MSRSPLSGPGRKAQQEPDTIPQRFADPEPSVAAVSWLVTLGPRWGALLLATATALAVAGMAWGLAKLLAPLGDAAAAVAAAIGMLVLLLPLMALLLKLAHQLERSRLLLERLDVAESQVPLATKAQFLGLVEREFARSRRYGHGAAVAILKVDRFRRLAELRGPAVGDAVMRELAAMVGRTLRGADALAQYSAEQLVVFLAESDATGSLDASERLRENAEQLEVVWREQRVRVTVSIGVVTLRTAHQHVQSVIDEAEAALEAAQQAGGNCVRAAPVDLPRSDRVGSGQP
jgi:diguanylate cyclase (GGDEF)-like protein